MLAKIQTLTRARCNEADFIMKGSTLQGRKAPQSRCHIEQFLQSETQNLNNYVLIINSQNSDHSR
jgi:hypothetical protein